MADTKQATPTIADALKFIEQNTFPHSTAELMVAFSLAYRSSQDAPKRMMVSYPGLPGDEPHEESPDCRGQGCIPLEKLRSCSNPNHALTDGSPSPHEIGSSCMAEAGPDRTTQDLSKLLPATFFADRDLAFRIERMVTAWQRAIVINQLQAGPDRGQQDALDYPAILERERTLVAEGVSAVKGAIRCREWLTEGRGPYEWDDDRWHGEFAAAISEILTALAPLERVAADLSNCPQKWDDVLKARAALAKAARAGQAPKGDRVKVEREPGCKCEYAIWTNANGCPLHDVSDPVQAQKE